MNKLIIATGCDVNYVKKIDVFLNTIQENSNFDENYLVIYALCSQEKYSGCGTTLMNTIKYLSTLLNCNEIKLQSVSDSNTLKFYKQNKFSKISQTYSHYYIVTPEDSKYDPFHYEVEGNVGFSAGGKCKKNKRKSKKGKRKSKKGKGKRKYTKKLIKK
jgi:hypothetical protein